MALHGAFAAAEVTAAPTRAGAGTAAGPGAVRRAKQAPGAGLWTFRGNERRAFYGVGPVPRRTPRIVWRYPRAGNMCAVSRDETGPQTWCGVGWTGQPNVIPKPGGRVEIRVGAFDRAYHFVDGATGRDVRPSLPTADLAKGSATSDPDGYPLYYGGSRDNKLRIVALDRRRPTVLWALDSHDGGHVVWNDDWDGAPLVVRGHLLVGGENSWFYVIRLNRSYGPDGKVRVRPRVVARVPGWDRRLLAARSDRAFSIESSVSYDRGVAYFANSAGLVQGWDVRRTMRSGVPPRRVFRFWMGDDTDATVAIDEQGYLYAAAELERFERALPSRLASSSSSTRGGRETPSSGRCRFGAWAVPARQARGRRPRSTARRSTWPRTPVESSPSTGGAATCAGPSISRDRRGARRWWSTASCSRATASACCTRSTSETSGAARARCGRSGSAGASSRPRRCGAGACTSAREGCAVCDRLVILRGLRRRVPNLSRR